MKARDAKHRIPVGIQKHGERRNEVAGQPEVWTSEYFGPQLVIGG